MGVKTIENRQQKGRRFTAASFSYGDNVAPCQSQWDRVRLNSSGLMMSSFEGRLRYQWCRGQFRKRQKNSVFRAIGFYLGGEAEGIGPDWLGSSVANPKRV
jgi:hypothetical protein